jgi:hypothetical protein
VKYIAQMQIREVEAVKVIYIENAAIEDVRQDPKYERNRNDTQNSTIQEKADLEIQGLFSIIVHKGIFLPVRQP